MTYQPTANRINILVMKAARLKAMDITGKTGEILNILIPVFTITACSQCKIGNNFPRGTVKNCLNYLALKGLNGLFYDITVIESFGLVRRNTLQEIYSFFI